MKYLVWCFNFLFVICTVCTAIEVSAPMSIKLEKNIKLRIECNVTPSDAIVEWKKDNSQLPDHVKTHGDPKTGVYSLEINKPGDKDLGNYTCSFKGGDEAEQRTIQVTGQVLVKVPGNINVVEGEKLRIHCQVAGGPPPELAWSFTPDGLDNNVTMIEKGGRYSMENDEHNITNSILIVKDITMDDRGHFYCSSKFDPSVSSKTMVRVKDKYAALWPFLGIVAEVVILCAIIFIYEKKHNKAELDESDTDQSPDQKNTPDHGKDGLRHRQ